ncbi:MAG TPA: class I SAM-dependent methyltransferase [Nitrospirota bacterium]|nr:class I SAM-dependent methyltransferase [Nitrospirota bacterium]
MFHDIPQNIMDRMKYLEQRDAADRLDGTTRMQRLRQITPEVGRFIALLAASAPDGNYIEIGTSAGYSTLWLALACRAVKRQITTFEILDEKAKLAKETFKVTGVNDVVNFIQADVLLHISRYKDIAFCFLDAEKEIYGQCYDEVIINMVTGGILVADNATSHEKELRPMLNQVLADDRVDALIVPIGSGELVCRKK